MIFYVIGNGFDLHYKLKTSYSDFKNFLLKNDNYQIVDKMDELFDEIGNYTPKEIDTWSQFEDMLTVFNHLDAEDIYNEAMDNAESDYNRAGYWDSPSFNVDYYNDYIYVLKQEFKNWIQTYTTKIKSDHYFVPEHNDFILSFNYTTTIEDNFSSVNKNILHIHGTIEQELILGHNDYQKAITLDIMENEDSDYRDITTRKAANNILKDASILYFKNSKKIINKYKDIFMNIPKYDKVVIMGLSCGPQDSMYITEIMKYATNIDFYYHDNKSKCNFKYYTSEYQTNVNYIHW